MLRSLKKTQMIKVRDFYCKGCGEVSEEFLSEDVTTLSCTCGGTKQRIPSSPRFVLEGASGDFPGSHMKWVKEHEKAGRKTNEGA